MICQPGYGIPQMMDHFPQMRILDHEQRHCHCNRIRLFIFQSFILCIHLFATKPALQGQGLGRKFLQAIIDDTRKRGFQVLRLDAFQHNTPACALYEKMGFQYRGVADLVYEDEDLPENLPIVVYEMQL